MDTANNVEHWRTIKFNVGYRVKKQKKKKKKIVRNNLQTLFTKTYRG